MNKWNFAAWGIILGCAVVLFTYLGGFGREMERLQQGIAEAVIRFHVRANSDSEEDQQLKLKVKEAVVEYLADTLEEAGTIEEARILIEAEIDNIISVAQAVISLEDKEYTVEAYFSEEYFPIKCYGDVTLPAGVYEAFRVDIGKAEGKNWWCVLFPKLCFVDVCYGTVPEESKESLELVLDEDEYELITGGDVDYEFRIFKFLNKLIFNK